MKNKPQPPTLRMGDFEWASAAKYLIWLETNVGLAELNYSRVFSFRIGKGGLLALGNEKRHQLARVKASLAALEVFAGENKEVLAAEELVVLRSLYVTYRSAIETLNQQLARVEILTKAQRVALFEETKEVKVDAPF